ncbi:MAG: polysaccharide export protein [Muribaculaceae bacterium]|nr:polysaccharide export protein [Muribaculaceae bacterium]
MKLKSITVAAGFSLILLASSCSSPKNIAYMQNAVFGQEEAVLNLNDIKVQPQDRLSIVISCKEPELARQFNLVHAEKLVGQDQQQSQGRVSIYTIDSEGNIEFPVLGKIHIAGLNRQQISEKIADTLKNGHWINDPIVSVEFANLHFSVVGEVNSPGTYAISNDRMTLLEGIAQAGDLTEFGEREIIVVREQNGKRTKFLVDLKDDSLFDSPAYYLQQNDVIYVQPNKAVARKAEDNPNNLKSISLWTSIASLLTTIAVLVFK